MEISKNEIFFKEILKDKVVTVKSLEDFDVAKSYFKRGFSVTLDFSLELVKLASKAEKLIQANNYDYSNHSILLSTSDFSSKYTDIVSLEQLENLKKSFQRMTENKELLNTLIPKEVIKKKYIDVDHEVVSDVIAPESFFSKVKSFFKKKFSKRPLKEEKIDYINEQIVVEAPKEVVLEEVEYKFTPTSKEIWQYYSNISKDKYYYEKAQQWGMILEYIIDFDKISSFKTELLFEIVDFSIKKSLELKAFSIETRDVERVFNILKTNWKYGHILEMWQEEKYKSKNKVKSLNESK